jgi:hypothetical protein
LLLVQPEHPEPPLLLTNFSPLLWAKALMSFLTRLFPQDGHSIPSSDPITNSSNSLSHFLQ